MFVFELMLRSVLADLRPQISDFRPPLYIVSSALGKNFGLLPAMAIETSPLIFLSSNSCIRSLSQPRDTFSNFLVSSMQTAACRSPSASNADVKVLLTRNGDSNITMVCGRSFSISKNRWRCPFFRGGNPLNV